jgi:iron-hydrogenase subunit gamma
LSRSISEILAAHEGASRDQLIPLLQEIQEEQGYISRDAIAALGPVLGLSASKIYGVATFYNQFRFEPLGQFHIQVCRGTACHVKGSRGILETIKRFLQVEDGQTTRDGRFSLEIVACLGACGLAPLICVNGEFHGQVSADTVVRILRSYRKEAVA